MQPSKLVQRVHFGVILILLVVSTALGAEPRYQAVPISPGFEFGTEKALILDTLAGHMWLWVESPAVGEENGGRYIIYQGQLAPGKEMGEVILQQEWPPSGDKP